MKNNRAAQFLPFDALTGFRKTISNVEKIKVEKKELLEDKQLEIEYYINNIQRGMMVTIIYFDKDEYYKVEGLVSKLDYQNKTIDVVKTRINVFDIYDIKCEEIEDFNPLGV